MINKTTVFHDKVCAVRPTWFIGKIHGDFAMN